jgi:hypothetical protein
MMGTLNWKIADPRGRMLAVFIDFTDRCPVSLMGQKHVKNI